MKLILISISFLGLTLTVAPAVFVFAGTLTWSQHTLYMVVGTVLWFATAPFWMHDKRPKQGFWKRRRPV